MRRNLLVLASAVFLSASFTAATGRSQQEDTLLVGVRGAERGLGSHIHAELEALGFDVVGLDGGTPLDELDPRVVAVVQLTAAGDSIEIWVRDNSTQSLAMRESVDASLGDHPAEGGSIVRAAESVRAALLRLGITPAMRVHASPSTPAHEEKRATVDDLPAKRPAERETLPSRTATTAPQQAVPGGHGPRAGVGVGLRFLHAQGGSSPAALAVLHGRWGPRREFGILVDMGVPFVASRLEGPEGAGILQPFMGTAGVWYDLPVDALLIPTVEAGARIIWLRMRGDAIPPYEGHANDAWLASPWLGASCRRDITKSVDLGLELSAGYAFPNHNVSFAGRYAGNWGKINLSGGLFLRIAFGGAARDVGH